MGRPAADAVPLGRVYGRGAGEAEAEQAEASACYPLDVRVGIEAGTGGEAGRLGTLDRHTEWRTPGFCSACP